MIYTVKNRCIFIAILLLQFAVSFASNLENLAGKQSFKDDDGPEEDDNDDGDSGIEIELGTGAIIGIAIGALALLIAIPILLCFCCGCFCFRKKEEKIIGVTPSASATLRKQHGTGITTNMEQENSRKFSGSATPNRRDSQFSSATAPPGQEFTPYPLNDNLGAFYYNLGYEPPPPYAFGDEINYMDDGWDIRNGSSRPASVRPSLANINENNETSKLGPGPSALKGRLG